MGNEMIERVAKAVCTVRAGVPCVCEKPDPEHCFMDLDVARAAIEAMRVPTVDMIVSATEEWLCIRAMEDRAEVIWDEMINVALDIAPPLKAQTPP